MTNPMIHFSVRRRTLLILAVASVSGTMACNTNDLLTVPTPDVVLPGTLEGKASLAGLYASAIGDFQVAYGGGYGALLDNNEGITQMSGLLSDELLNAETFPTRIEVDRRATSESNSSTLQTFQDLQRARAMAEFVSRRFLQFDAANSRRSEVQSLGAFSYVMLAENYCNGVPISFVTDAGEEVYGAGQTGRQLLEASVAKFDSAIAVAAAASDNNALNLARIGKGRALVDLNRLADAATAVASVPSGFNYSIVHSENTSRQNNAIYTFNVLEGRFSVSDHEGTNGLAFVSLKDPRAPTYLSPDEVGFNGVTEQYFTTKYGERNSPTPLAIGAEARLIQAEAALRTGDLPTFLIRLNEARAAAPTYPDSTGAPTPKAAPLTIADIPPTATARENLLFQERALALFLTAHRVGDLRRLIWQYNRNTESVFPTGAYHLDANYGTAVNLPIPKEESNNENPSYAANPSCINRSAGID